MDLGEGLRGETEDNVVEESKIQVEQTNKYLEDFREIMNSPKKMKSPKDDISTKSVPDFISFTPLPSLRNEKEYSEVDGDLKYDLFYKLIKTSLILKYFDYPQSDMFSDLSDFFEENNFTRLERLLYTKLWQLKFENSSNLMEIKNLISEIYTENFSNLRKNKILDDLNHDYSLNESICIRNNINVNSQIANNREQSVKNIFQNNCRRNSRKFSILKLLKTKISFNSVVEYFNLLKQIFNYEITSDKNPILNKIDRTKRQIRKYQFEISQLNSKKNSSKIKELNNLIKEKEKKLVSLNLELENIESKSEILLEIQDLILWVSMIDPNELQ